jgi:hypothetical protein
MGTLVALLFLRRLMTPLKLTDTELDIIFAAARPLAVQIAICSYVTLLSGWRHCRIEAMALCFKFVAKCSASIGIRRSASRSSAQ